MDSNASQTKTYLTDLEIVERSVVRRPANRRKKLAQKSKEIDMSMTDAVKAALEERLKSEDNTDEMKAAFKEAMEAMDGEMDEEKAAKIKRALSMGMKPYQKAEEKETDAERIEREKAEEQAALEENPKLAARMKALEDQVAEDRKAREKAEKELKAKEKAEHLKSWKEKTAPLTGLAGTNLEEAGEMLARIDEALPEDAAKVLEIFKAASAATGKVHGKERGSSLTDDGSESPANAKLKAKAKEIREKAEEKGIEMDEHAAMNQAINENPALYSEYEEERKAADQDRK